MERLETETYKLQDVSTRVRGGWEGCLPRRKSSKAGRIGFGDVT